MYLNFTNFHKSLKNFVYKTTDSLNLAKELPSYLLGICQFLFQLFDKKRQTFKPDLKHGHEHPPCLPHTWRNSSDSKSAHSVCLIINFKKIVLSSISLTLTIKSEKIMPLKIIIKLLYCCKCD